MYSFVKKLRPFLPINAKKQENDWMFILDGGLSQKRYVSSVVIAVDVAAAVPLEAKVSRKKTLYKVT